MSASVTVGAELLPVVEAATRAPSIHNTQPWMFAIADDRIDVFADRRRQLAVADPDGHALRVSCGAAVFNLRLGLAHLGHEVDVTLLPDPGRPDLLASVGLGWARPTSPAQAALYTAIPKRHSNRYPFLDTDVPLDVRTRLRDAAQAEGAWLDLLIGPSALGTVAALVRAADRMLTSREEYRAELGRWTGRDDGALDGVERRAGGPAPEPYDLLMRRDFGGTPRTPGRDYERDPLVAVLGTEGDSPRDDLVAGQALQRVLLSATQAGLVTSLMSQPIDVPSVREELRVGLRRFGSPKMLLRVGYGIASVPTARRPVTDVLGKPTA